MGVQVPHHELESVLTIIFYYAGVQQRERVWAMLSYRTYKQWMASSMSAEALKTLRSPMLKTESTQ